MAKTFLKAGKVVVVLNGRYAGKKAVIVRAFDNSKGRNYGHCLLAGVDQAPRKVTKSMTKREILRRTTIRPFIKVINVNHLMPTRYSFDIENMSQIMSGKNAEVGTRMGGDAKKQIKTIFEKRYRSGKNLWFFSKLRF